MPKLIGCRWSVYRTWRVMWNIYWYILHLFSTLQRKQQQQPTDTNSNKTKSNDIFFYYYIFIYLNWHRVDQHLKHFNLALWSKYIKVSYTRINIISALNKAKMVFFFLCGMKLFLFFISCVFPVYGTCKLKRFLTTSKCSLVY